MKNAVSRLGATIVLACLLPLTAEAAQSGKETSEAELSCLAKAIYFEARGEPAAGQMAVGQVILNRTAHEDYPSTICGVVYQNASRRNACQFSFACDGRPETITNRDAYAEIEQRAKDLLSCPPSCGGIAADSTHYHASYVSPTWSRKLTVLGRIGEHIFYRLGEDQNA